GRRGGVGPTRLYCVVGGPVWGRLSGEQGKKAAALATQALGLLAEAVEFGLLLGRGVFVALDLLRSCGVDRGTAIDRGELAFEPQTDLAARGRAGSRGRIGSGNRVGRRRGGERKGELRRRRRGAENEDGQGGARSAQDFRDRCANHGARPDGHSRRWKRRNGDQSVKIPGLWALRHGVKRYFKVPSPRTTTGCTALQVADTLVEIDLIGAKN